jgi:hypothetical protein
MAELSHVDNPDRLMWPCKTYTGQMVHFAETEPKQYDDHLIQMTNVYKTTCVYENYKVCILWQLTFLTTGYE